MNEIATEFENALHPVNFSSSVIVNFDYEA